jgi:nucleoside permease NupC
MVTRSTVSIQDTGHEQNTCIAIAVVVAFYVLFERAATLSHKVSILIHLAVCSFVTLPSVGVLLLALQS